MKKIIFLLLFAMPLWALGQVDSVEVADIADSLVVENYEIWEFSDVMPQFNTGNDDIQTFVAKNLVYPDSAQKNSIQGTVFAQFIVEKDGSVSNLRIAKGIGYGCDEEVIRVMKMAKFKPGLQKGKPVRVRMGMPVKFRLR